MEKRIVRFVVLMVLSFAMGLNMTVGAFASTAITCNYIEEENTIRVTGVPVEEEYRIQAVVNNVISTFHSDGCTDIPVNTNGTYSIGVYRRNDSTKYSLVSKFSIEVNSSKNYLGTSEVVDMHKASNLFNTDYYKAISEKVTNSEKVLAAYNFVSNYLKYDEIKAKTVEKGYMPNIDNSLDSKRGICFDYAAMFAAIMRKNNIPCKVVCGNIGTIYHAWNSVYINGEWLLIDCTWKEYETTKYVRTVVHEW